MTGSRPASWSRCAFVLSMIVSPPKRPRIRRANGSK
jgi:hypothetical protein